LSIVNCQELTLLFAGDAMQHQSQINNAYRKGIYDYSSYFKHLKDYITEADIAIVNLEVTLGGKPYTGYPMFSAPDEFPIALKDAGFDVFLTSNNHCVDRGKKGLERTLDVLDSLGVRHVGTYRNQAEKVRNYPMMLTKNNIRMAFLNYTYSTNGISVSSPNVVNYIDTIQIKNNIRDAKGFLGADLVIVAIHWGEEYKLNQNKEQERLTKLMFREGADLVIGSHPHVVQPTHVLKNEKGEITNLVVYSLGNFVSAQVKENTDGGQMLKVVVAKENFKTKIKSCSYQLVYVDRQKNEDKIDFTLLPVSRFENMKDSISPTTYDKMMIFARNARDLFDKYNVDCLEDTVNQE
jgi:poly-gamma-glutamate synthesis protein (capsule biosynthesis protein)